MFGYKGGCKGRAPLEHINYNTSFRTLQGYHDYFRLIDLAIRQFIQTTTMQILLGLLVDCYERDCRGLIFGNVTIDIHF